jgi:hypothetical protein
MHLNADIPKMKKNAAFLLVFAPIALGVAGPVMAQGSGQQRVPGLVAGAVPPAPSSFGASQAPTRIVIQGTGNLSSVNTRTTTELDPPCVELVERSGSVALTGVITTAVGLNSYYSRALRDSCDPTTQIVGMTMQWYDNLTATIAGRTGRIRIEAIGPFEGDALIPPGTELRLRWKITGLDGDLRGMEGEGIAVGRSTAFDNQQPTANTTYTVTLFLPK